MTKCLNWIKWSIIESGFVNVSITMHGSVLAIITFYDKIGNRVDLVLGSNGATTDAFEDDAELIRMFYTSYFKTENLEGVINLHDHTKDPFNLFVYEDTVEMIDFHNIIKLSIKAYLNPESSDDKPTQEIVSQSYEVLNEFIFDSPIKTLPDYYVGFCFNTTEAAEDFALATPDGTHSILIPFGDMFYVFVFAKQFATLNDAMEIASSHGRKPLPVEATAKRILATLK